MSFVRHLPLLAALAFAISSSSLHAQVAVYKLDFESVGETINYRSYQSGYYVAPMTGGVGSLILMLTTGGVRQYFTYNNFGEIFIAVSGSRRKAVFSATAANTVSTTTFYAIGNADDQIEVETRAATSQVFVARKLEGYSVSADSERDLPFSSAGSTDVGVAGASSLKCNFDEGMSTAANRENRTVATEIANIQDFLASKGYTNGLTTGGAGAGGGTGANQGGGTSPSTTSTTQGR